MTCSPARLAANRRNAAKSTGPKTDEGKARSRLNALRHGLAAEVAVPSEDADAVAARFAAFEEELRPSGGVARFLAQRAALLSVRLDRCARHEAAMTSRRIRDAEASHDDEREALIEALGAGLADDPARVVRKLKATPEGIDWLIRAWHAVEGDLLRPSRVYWSEGHHHRVAHLMGRRPDQYPPSPIDALCKAGWGDFSGLSPDQEAGLEPQARKAWARGQVARTIDAEIAALEALRPTLDLEAAEADRAEAGLRALFDPSKEATLARKYEAAAERGLYRALRELRSLQAAAESADAAEPTPTPTSEVPLASFVPPDPEPSTEPTPEPAEPLAARPTRPRRPIGPDDRPRPPQSPASIALTTGATRATSSGWAQTSTSAS